MSQTLVLVWQPSVSQSQLQRSLLTTLAGFHGLAFQLAFWNCHTTCHDIFCRCFRARLCQCQLLSNIPLPRLWLKRKGCLWKL